MSLVAFATRVATVRILRRALPDFDVIDSPLDPIAALEVKGRPIAAVFTPHSVGKMRGHELLAGDPVLTLAIQFVLPAKIELQAGPHVVKLDTRRQGADTAANILESRAERALLALDDPWAEFWRVMVTVVEKTPASYIIPKADGSIIGSGVTLMLTCKTLHEPRAGAAPAGAWADLISLMRADPGDDNLSALADWLEAEITGAAMRPFERDLMYAGDSRGVGRAVGVSDRFDAPGDPSAPFDVEHPAAP